MIEVGQTLRNRIFPYRLLNVYCGRSNCAVKGINNVSSSAELGFNDSERRRQSQRQDGLSDMRMSSCNRSLCVHTNTSLTPQQQQIRGLCSAIIPTAAQSSAKWRHPNLNSVKPSSRGYCKSSDGRLLHKSRTAYYDILNVLPDATQADIEAAYYREACIHHPDKKGSDLKVLLHYSAISEAYMVLSNASLKEKYDQGVLSEAEVRRAEKQLDESLKTFRRDLHHVRLKNRPFEMAAVWLCVIGGVIIYNLWE